MGDSLPPPAGIDLVGSYARRRGADAELFLSEPKPSLLEGLDDSATVVLRRKGREVSARVEQVTDERGPHLVARARRADLSDGTWTIRLRADGDKPVDARLLVQGDRPLVLLWGAKGSPSLTPKRAAHPARRTAASAAGRAVDAALTPLPLDTARKLRARARAAARRVLR